MIRWLKRILGIQQKKPVFLKNLVPASFYEKTCVDCPDPSFKNCSKCIEDLKGVDLENE